MMLIYCFMVCFWYIKGFSGSSAGKESACNAADLSLIPGSGRSSGEGMANHSSILAWRIPWTEEPGRLQSMGSQRVGYDWATTTLRFTSYYSSQCLMEVDIRCSSLGSTEVAILSFLTPLFYSLLTFFPLQSITSQINYPYASLFLSLFFWGNTI